MKKKFETLKTCTLWDNGCNTCQVFEGKIQKCTENQCKLFRKPKCLQRIDIKYKEADIPKEKCGEWFDGCNICKIKNGEVDGCGEKFCEDYDKEFCLKKPEEVKIEKPKMPKGCKLWYDGCNECKIESGKPSSCTKRKCSVSEKP